MGIANWTQIENALQARIALGLGVPGDRVRWGDTSRDSPVTAGDHAVLRVGNIASLSPATPEQNVTDNPQAFPGGEILLNSLEPTEFELTITVYTTRTTGSFSAYARATSARSALHSESTTDALEAANVVIVQCEAVQSLPALLETEFQGKAVFTALVRISDGNSEAATFIETLGIEYGEGPVLHLVGAEDVAGLARFERWARVNQPAFPRIVDGPRGRPGVQFSRLGVDVVSLQPRNAGNLRDTNINRSALSRAWRNGFTFGFWFRPDPLTNLGVGVNQTGRIVSFTGSQGTPTAANAITSLTWGRSTDQFFLNTQVPSNVGGTGLNGNASIFTSGPLPVGVWQYICVSCRPNGLDVPPLEYGATADWYINGALQFSEVGTGGTGTTGPRLPVWDLFPAPFTIAAVNGQWASALTAFNQPLDASIADLVLYPRALSATEIATLYTSGPFGFRVSRV